MTLIQTDAKKIAEAFVLAVANTRSYGMSEAQPRLEAVLANMATRLSVAEKSAVWADLVTEGWKYLVNNAEKLRGDHNDDLDDMIYCMRTLAKNPKLLATPLLAALQMSPNDVDLNVQHWHYTARDGGWFGYGAIEAGVSVVPDFCAWAVRRGLINATDVGLLSDAHELHMYRSGLVVREDMERARNDRRGDDAE